MSGGVLIDTNVISELRKGERCNANVSAWYARLAEDDVFLSVLVVSEIRRGVERERGSDPAKAEVLEHWLQAVVEGFSHRILSVDGRVAEEWGRLSAIRSVPAIDGLLAATAKANRLTLATRNTADMADLGVALVNPFEQRG